MCRIRDRGDCVLDRRRRAGVGIPARQTAARKCTVGVCRAIEFEDCAMDWAVMASVGFPALWTIIRQRTLRVCRP